MTKLDHYLEEGIGHLKTREDLELALEELNELMSGFAKEIPTSPVRAQIRQMREVVWDTLAEDYKI